MYAGIQLESVSKYDCLLEIRRKVFACYNQHLLME
jgi:hypothetical protein